MPDFPLIMHCSLIKPRSMSNYFDKLNTHFAAVSSGQERSRKFFIIVRVFISTFQKF